MTIKKSIFYTLLAALVLVSAFAGWFYAKYAELRDQDTVYISAFGDCYHNDPACSGMVQPLAVTLHEAADIMYRQPCSVCVE